MLKDEFLEGVPSTETRDPIRAGDRALLLRMNSKSTVVQDALVFRYHRQGAWVSADARGCELQSVDAPFVDGMSLIQKLCGSRTVMLQHEMSRRTEAGKHAKDTLEWLCRNKTNTISLVDGALRHVHNWYKSGGSIITPKSMHVNHAGKYGRHIGHEEVDEETMLLKLQFDDVSHYKSIESVEEKEATNMTSEGNMDQKNALIRAQAFVKQSGIRLLPEDAPIIDIIKNNIIATASRHDTMARKYRDRYKSKSAAAIVAVERELKRMLEMRLLVESAALFIIHVQTNIVTLARVNRGSVSTLMGPPFNTSPEPNLMTHMVRSIKTMMRIAVETDVEAGKDSGMENVSSSLDATIQKMLLDDIDKANALQRARVALSLRPHTQSLWPSFRPNPSFVSKDGAAVGHLFVFVTKGNAAKVDISTTDHDSAPTAQRIRFDAPMSTAPLMFLGNPGEIAIVPRATYHLPTPIPPSKPSIDSGCSAIGIPSTLTKTCIAHLSNPLADNHEFFDETAQTLTSNFDGLMDVHEVEVNDVGVHPDVSLFKYIVDPVGDVNQTVDVFVSRMSSLRSLLTSEMAPIIVAAMNAVGVPPESRYRLARVLECHNLFSRSIDVLMARMHNPSIVAAKCTLIAMASMIHDTLYAMSSTKTDVSTEMNLLIKFAIKACVTFVRQNAYTSKDLAQHIGKLREQSKKRKMDALEAIKGDKHLARTLLKLGIVGYEDIRVGFDDVMEDATDRNPNTFTHEHFDDHAMEFVYFDGGGDDGADMGTDGNDDNDE